MTLLSQMHHPNIVKYITSFTDKFTVTLPNTHHEVLSYAAAYDAGTHSPIQSALGRAECRHFEALLSDMRT